MVELIDLPVSEHEYYVIKLNGYHFYQQKKGRKLTCIRTFKFNAVNKNMNFLHIIRFRHFASIQQKLNECASVVQLIEKHTMISVNHLTPEIKLRLITPECNLWDVNANLSPFNDPYWAFYWPGGQVLSRYILDHPAFFKDLKVVDIGCGSGACSIAACISGAKQVIANDTDNVACISVAVNASLNNVKNIYLCHDNLIADLKELHSADCFLIADMFYDEEFSKKLLNFILNLNRSGKTVLIGDPGRLAFKRLNLKSKVKLLAEYNLPQNVCLENNGFSTSSIWQFC